MPTALITGASAGLGVDFCHILAERGYDLVMVARNEERLKAWASILEGKYKVKCKAISFDLSLPNSAQSLVDYMASLNYKIDVLINNAGFGIYGDLVTNSLTSVQDLIQLNVTTLTGLTRLLLPDMIKRRSGRILHVASTAAFLPGPHMASYYASKAFVLSFSEAVSQETKGTGVTITALCPGPTKTEFFERAKMGNARLKSIFAADSRKCAEHGIRAMFAGKVVVIDGTFNWIAALSLRFLPRNIVRTISGFIAGRPPSSP